MTPAGSSFDAAQLLQHAGWLRRLASALARDTELADDVVQETWLAALERRPDPDQPLKPWLARVVRNLIAKAQRSRIHRRGVEESAARGEALPSPADLALRASLHRDLVEAVLALDEPYRSTLLLRYLDELAPRTIAARQGVPVRTVHARLTRGLSQLRERLDAGPRGRERWLGAFLPLERCAAPAALLLGTFLMKTKLALALGVLVLALVWMRPWQDHPTAASSVSQDGSSPELAAGAARRDADTRTAALEAPDRSAVALPIAGVEPDPERDLRGVVVDTSGQPLAGVEIQVVAPFARQVPELLDDPHQLDRIVATTRSADDGSFSVRLEPRRVYDVVAERQGFARTWLQDLYAGEDVRLVLARAASIQGRVLDADGQSPVRGARVEIWPGIVGNFARVIFVATSDEQGSFAFEALVPDSYRIEVEANEHVVRRAGLGSLGEGEVRSLEIVLEHGATIHGVVTDGEAKLPIAGASVNLRAASAANAARCDESGRYELRGVPVGFSDQIVASAPGYGTFSLELFSVPAQGLEQDMFLLPARHASGRVVDGEGVPVAGAFVIAKASAWLYGSNQSDLLRTTTDAAGRFELLDLRLDLRHTLLVHADGHATEVRDFPAREWEEKSIDLGDIVLERPGGIAGRLIDPAGAALPGRWVLLGAEPRHRDDLAPAQTEAVEGYASGEGFGFGRIGARTDARGRYSFTNLSAGHYWLSGGDKGFARRASLELELEEGEHPSDVDLVLDPEPSITGIVVDDRGAPLAGMSLGAFSEGPEVHGESGGVELHRATYNLSRSDGHFELRALDEGFYSIHLGTGLLPTSIEDGEGEHSAESTIPNVQAGTHDLRIVARRAIAIRGRVVGPDDAPLAGAAITVPARIPNWWSMSGSSDREGRFTLWIEVSTTTDIKVAPPSKNNPGSWEPVFDSAGNVDTSYEVLVEDVAAGTTDLVVKLSRLP